MLNTKIREGFSDSVKKAIHLVTFDPDILPVGSFFYKINKYPSDIDILEKTYGCCSLDEAVRQWAKDIQEKAIDLYMERKNGYYLADFKIGLDYGAKDPILRWKLPELIAMNKQTSTGYKTLSDALKDPTLVKMDIFAPINGRYVEVSNIFYLIEVDRYGNETHLFPWKDYSEALKHDIQKYSSEEFFNPMKVLKRMWVLARIRDDKEMLRKISPIFNSDVSIIYQVVGDIATLIDMIKKIPDPPYDYFYNEISTFKDRLSVVNLDFDEAEIFDLIDVITNNMITGDSLIIYLQKMNDILKKYLNAYTITYANKRKIFPISQEYMEGSGYPTENYLPDDSRLITAKILIAQQHLL